MELGRFPVLLHPQLKQNIYIYISYVSKARLPREVLKFNLKSYYSHLIGDVFSHDARIYLSHSHGAGLLVGRAFVDVLTSRQ